MEAEVFLLIAHSRREIFFIPNIKKFFSKESVVLNPKKWTRSAQLAHKRENINKINLKRKRNKKWNIATTVMEKYTYKQ